MNKICTKLNKQDNGIHKEWKVKGYPIKELGEFNHEDGVVVAIKEHLKQEGWDLVLLEYTVKGEKHFYI